MFLSWMHKIHKAFHIVLYVVHYKVYFVHIWANNNLLKIFQRWTKRKQLTGLTISKNSNYSKKNPEIKHLKTKKHNYVINLLGHLQYLGDYQPLITC